KPRPPTASWSWTSRPAAAACPRGSPERTSTSSCRRGTSVSTRSAGPWPRTPGGSPCGGPRPAAGDRRMSTMSSRPGRRCGPAGLMDAVEAAMRAWPRGSLQIERFAPKTLPVQAEVAFEVELALSGEILSVPPGKSILDVAEDAGVLVLSSCREGTCGTCETAILDGAAEHRDSILSEDEQAA